MIQWKINRDLDTTCWLQLGVRPTLKQRERAADHDEWFKRDYVSIYVVMVGYRTRIWYNICCIVKACKPVWMREHIRAEGMLTAADR